MTVHRSMTFGKIVCDMDHKTLTLMIDLVRPPGDLVADCALCAGAIKAASAPAAQLVRDTVRSVPRDNESPLTGQQYAAPIPGYRVPLRSESLATLCTRRGQTS